MMTMQYTTPAASVPRRGLTVETGAPVAATETAAPLPSNYRPTTCPILTPPSQSGGRRGYNLFVGTLPGTATKEEVEILFAPFGTLADTYLLKQGEGAKGKYRCGFVSFREYSSAAHAIARLNGFHVQAGCPPLCVRFANPPKAQEGDSNEGSIPDSPTSSASLGPTPTASSTNTPSATDFAQPRYIATGLAGSPKK